MAATEKGAAEFRALQAVRVAERGREARRATPAVLVEDAGDMGAADAVDVDDTVA